MGISLSDIGLMGSGYNEVMDADLRRRQGAEDRTYQIEERARKQREAIAAEQDAERRRAYESELRAELPRYLSGDQAIPARTAVQAQPADDGRLYENGSVPRAAQPAAPAQPNEEGMYRRFQEIAAQHGRLDHYEAMKDRLKKFQDEGVIDFIKKARQGASDEDLVQTFNKNGKVKLAGLRKVNDDDYQGVTQDGKEVSLNLHRMTESLLGAKDLIAHVDKAADRERKAKEAEEKAKIAQQRASDQGTLTAANIGLREAQAALVTARAEGRTGGGADPSQRRAGNWNAFDKQVKDLATTHLTSPDPDTGKPTLDRKNLVALTSMASAIARRNPELSPAESLEQASNKIAEIQAIQEGSTQQAETESRKLPFDGERQRASWVKSRSTNLAKMRSSTTEAQRPDAPVAADGAPAPAAPAPKASGELARPATDADYKALPKGTRYVNPSDGRIYVKN